MWRPADRRGGTRTLVRSGRRESCLYCQSSLQEINPQSFLFNLKSFVSSESQAAEYLSGTPVRSRTFRQSNFENIPQEGQIQEFVAKILRDNNALDAFHVNLASNNTNRTDSINTIQDTDQLLWIHSDSFSLDVDLYQEGTDKNEGGDCGQMQSNSEGTLDFNSNDCLVDLKPLCMRETGSGITVSENQRRRWRKVAKKKETLARQQRNRWRKRTRVKLKRSIDIWGRGEQRVDPKCRLWKDLILPGDVYLGKKGWKF